jgi:E3 ubiquitin-protein ligase HUWE1
MEEGDDEDNISDEDVELEGIGIGEIEGLSGDHAVNIEVRMEEGDDEDDEDDEPSDEDDEDEDSDDMDEDEEGEARDEFVDEDGNPSPLVEGDDGDEWSDEEDDDEEEDEEEDYEGRAADEEEERQHEAHIAHGAIGHLVRALGGDDHQGAVEILQRMDEGIDEEQMELEGYMEDDQDEEGALYASTSSNMMSHMEWI